MQTIWVFYLHQHPTGHSVILHRIWDCTGHDLQVSGSRVMQGHLLCQGARAAGQLRSLPQQTTWTHCAPKFTPLEEFLALLWKLISEKVAKAKNDARAWGQRWVWEERSNSALTSTACAAAITSASGAPPALRGGPEAGKGAEAFSLLIHLFLFFLPSTRPSH